MRVQRCGLGSDGFDHPLVGMADMGDVIVTIEVFPPFGIPKPHTLTAHDMHGLVVKGRDIWAQQAGAPFSQLCIVRHRTGPK